MSNPVLYSRKNCPNCEAVVEQLDKLGIGYTKVMVDENYKAKAKLIAAGFDSIPVLECANSVFIGGSTETIISAARDLQEEAVS